MAPFKNVCPWHGESLKNWRPPGENTINLASQPMGKIEVMDRQVQHHRYPFNRLGSLRLYFTAPAVIPRMSCREKIR
jgi:hypothetical protein